MLKKLWCGQCCWATHSLPTEVGTGVLWVLTGNPPVCCRVQGGSEHRAPARALRGCECLCRCLALWSSCERWVVRSVLCNMSPRHARTLCTQGQEATKTNKLTLTESRDWPENSMDLSTPSGPRSQSWFKTFRVVTPGFRGHHDLLHQGMLSILSVWRVSTVYQSPCLSSVGFLHGSDQGSYTAFRYQGQCIIHLHATIQVCFTQRSHGCHGNRISLDFASIHQLVRNRTDVYSEAESKVFVLCIVSIERQRLAQASQVLEQPCVQRFGSGGHNR